VTANSGPALVVGAPALSVIEDHAGRAWPHECCGLLLGGNGWVARAWPARNAARRPTRYRVDPADHFAALRDARNHGDDVVGAYHSHPASPPLPSRTDRAQGIGGFVYVVIGPVRRRTRRRYAGLPGAARRRLAGWAPLGVTAWRYEEGNFVPLRVVRTP
jgi:proteasome lid subunit RPN8/RPN11